MGAGSGDSVAAELIPVYQNVAQVIVQTELQEAVAGAGDCPSILVMVIHDQTVSFRTVPEFPVVVGAAPATVLNAANVVVIMYHLMEQRGAHFFDGARQCSCANIDFMGAAQLGYPGIFPKGEMAIGFRGGLDGDSGS